MVAHGLLIDVQTRRPHGDAVVLQRPENGLRGDGVVAADLKIPDDEVAAEHQHQRQHRSGQQHVPPAQAPPEHRYAAAAAQVQAAAGVLRRLPQTGQVPAYGPQSQAHRRLPCQLPEGDAPCAAEVQHPLRAAALDPHQHLPL